LCPEVSGPASAFVYMNTNRSRPGNYYSMANNGDVRARIFFAQGCELQVAPEDHEAEGESTMFYKSTR